MLFFCSSKAAAFAFRSVARSASAPLASFRLPTSLVRHMSSSSGMPFDDAKMPFYALGVNVARQVGSQIKELIDDDELEIMLQGFGDTMRGTSLQDSNAILSKYAMSLNQIIAERSNSILDRTKKAGADFITNFLDCNEEAILTESGLFIALSWRGAGSNHRCRILSRYITMGLSQTVQSLTPPFREVRRFPFHCPM